jgi:hypothetical protein
LAGWEITQIQCAKSIHIISVQVDFDNRKTLLQR